LRNVECPNEDCIQITEHVTFAPIPIESTNTVKNREQRALYQHAGADARMTRKLIECGPDPDGAGILAGNNDVAKGSTARGASVDRGQFERRTASRRERHTPKRVPLLSDCLFYEMLEK
jgi:hypothetical protein